MASLTRWTWVWVNSECWWWTGRPGVLRFMGSQRVGHNWVTELNWTELIYIYKCMCAKLLQSCPTLCHRMDCSLPASSVHGILQEKLLEWVAMLSSRGSSQPRDRTCISYVSCIDRCVLHHKGHLGSLIFVPSSWHRAPTILGISWAIGNVLGWPKSSFCFFITSYRKTWMNFLAHSVFCYLYQALSITLAFMLMRWPRMGILDSLGLGLVTRNSD